jgi:hypothetical protein
MKMTDALAGAMEEAGARVRVGYPWWLRPWLARNVVGITLGRTIYVSRAIASLSDDFVERLMRHELAHVAQVNRLGLPRFLWMYGSEFVRNYRRERSIEAAYRSISFEVEAAAAEEVL